MAEQKIEQKIEQVPEIDLLEKYQELKESSISKEQYEKDIKELKEKNNLYLNAIISGKKNDIPEDNIPLDKQIEDLTNFRGTNLEYWEKTTTAIDKMLKSYPKKEIAKTIKRSGLDELIKVNEGMKYIISKSDGNSDQFINNYNNLVEESSEIIASEINEAGSLVNYLANKK